MFQNEYLMHISPFYSLYWHTFYKFYSEVTYGRIKLVVKVKQIAQTVYTKLSTKTTTIAALLLNWNKDPTKFQFSERHFVEL